MRIGFIGVGKMGSAMARRTRAAGFPVAAWDRRPAALEAAAANGVSAAASLDDLIGRADVVITMLPGSPEVEAVVQAPRGILETAPAGTVLVDMSSSQPSSTIRLAEALEARGLRMLDAPVSGGVIRAEKGDLTIMVGGQADVLEGCRPVLAAMGSRIFHVGGHGAGHVMKAVNNLCSAGNLLVTTEALAVAVKAGIAPEVATAILQVSTGKSNASDWKFPQFILTGTFDAGFAMGLMRKDLEIFCRVAAELGVPALLANLTREIYGLAERATVGEDHTAVARLLERWAGIEIRVGRPKDPA